jgi:hypothetical protein
MSGRKRQLPNSIERNNHVCPPDVSQVQSPVEKSLTVVRNSSMTDVGAQPRERQNKKRSTPNPRSTNRERSCPFLNHVKYLLSWRVGGHALGGLIFVYASHKLIDCLQHTPATYSHPILLWSGVLVVTGYVSAKIRNSSEGEATIRSIS